jgi:predicted DNA-binding transcriptional regulator YafY
MKLPIRTDKKPTKVALARLLKIHDQLNEAARGRRRVNCSTLAADLNTTAKTIQRDISYLRDQLKLPIEYDFGERAFSYPDADTPFPLGHNLSQDERVALVVARQSLDVFEGVNFGAELRSAFDKITGGLLGESGDFMEQSLDRFISVRTPGASRVDAKVFRAVRVALLDGRELRLEYQAKGRPAFTPRRLHPLHLACIANRWVLVAVDADKSETRTYILARCRNPTVTQKKFQRPTNFDPVAHLGTSFGVLTGSGTIIVKLRISTAGAHHVLERNWHPTQRETNLPGGAVEVTFALSDLNDVTRWILGFGSDVEVIEPAELRATIAAEGTKMAQRNSP